MANAIPRTPMTEAPAAIQTIAILGDSELELELETV
jgi:hypothetical protein